MTIQRQIAVNPTEAAKLAAVSRPTLYRRMKLDGFPVCKIGGCTRIPVEEFERWLLKQGGISVEQ